MTIKEICEKYDITADTLRYYERVGVIPTVKRTKGGIREYDGEAVGWVENAICMRSAGVPIEMLIEYVRLYQEGDGTLVARKALLEEARAEAQHQIEKYRETIRRLDYKISRYEEAVRTGVLSWDKPEKAGDKEEKT